MKHPILFVFRGLRRSYLYFCLGIAVVVGAAACTDPPPVSLSAEDREQIDTLYSQRVQVLRAQLDSLCDSLFEGEVQRAVDSMLPIRRAEEERLRQRIPAEVDLLRSGE